MSAYLTGKCRCPHCGQEINPASLLARRGLGRARQFTAKERARRADRLAKARRARWGKVAVATLGQGGTGGA